MQDEAIMRIKFLSICLLLMLLSTADAATFYLLRHAEKQTGDNPELTAQGQKRAGRVAKLLSLTDIQAIYSTDYQRTRQTAEPIAQVKNLPVQLYNPKSLKQFAQKLIDLNENAIIVGHSNTTPELVNLLSGQTVPAMDEGTFNLIYQVITIPDSTDKKAVINVLSSQ